MKFFPDRILTFLVIVCCIFLVVTTFILWANNRSLEIESGPDGINYYPFPHLSEEELENYLKATFPLADNFESIIIEDEKLFKIFKNGELIGWAKLIEKDIPCPTCADVRFICGIDENRKIKNIVLINEIDLRGLKLVLAKIEIGITEITKKFFGKKIGFNVTLVEDFLNQLYNRKFEDRYVQIGKDISVISGATQSSYFIVEGINEFLREIKELNLIN